MKRKTSNTPSIKDRIWYFFPLQLLLLNLKRNHIVLIIWTILFLFATKNIGLKYGIPFLFLSPEYFGNVDLISYFILGSATGGFIMAYNIYSYIMFASDFPFLATFSRPFIKFCYNNFIIPFFYVIVYIWFSFSFQANEELIPKYDIFINLLGFCLGILFFIIISSIYFIRFNKNIYHFSNKDKNYYENIKIEDIKEATLHKKTKWYYRLSQKREIKVVTYINNFREIKLARNINHYDIKLLKKVFAQNHINASIFEIMLFITFLILGIFRDNPLFNIPAGASIFIFFTIALLLYSALYSWFKGWTLSLFIVLIIMLNSFSNSTKFYFFKSFANGIDYSVNPIYSYKTLNNIATNKFQIEQDSLNTISCLNNWKNNYVNKYNKLPKFVVLNISGGGLRSALWSFYSISYIDSVCNNKLLPQTELITGASGGMIGISYLRELYLKKQLGDTSVLFTNKKYIKNISKDLLNPLLFGIATTDFIFKFQKIKFGEYYYPKDRGYSFENKIERNLNGIFKNKTLNSYKKLEENGKIPMLILTPTIANDGRRLIVSPHSLSYLSTDTITYNNIDYQQLFKNNNPNNLKYLSALRMSANFPYILPMVSLPSEPNLKIIDAGIKDNYGVKTSVKFLEKFEKWISKNTSGVVFIEVRDTPKINEITKDEHNDGLIQRLTLPVGNIVKNLLRIQDYNNTQTINNITKNYDTKIDCFTIFVNKNKKQSISMSWHLTQLDCKNIFKSIYSVNNQNCIKKIQKLLN